MAGDVVYPVSFLYILNIVARSGPYLLFEGDEPHMFLLKFLPKAYIISHLPIRHFSFARTGILWVFQAIIRSGLARI